ncbi:hypothetical protein [Spirosoma arcticum]
MKRFSIKQAWVLIGLVAVWSCGPKEEPQPALPGYLRVPASLEGYTGSGRIEINGPGLTLLAEGPEELNAGTNTYSGVLGNINREDVSTYFTLGQPRNYRQRDIVPQEYRSNGSLLIMNTRTPGTYQMGTLASPGPRGELADLLLYLPGPQLYYAESGSLTISEATLIKTEGSSGLYRITGTFQATMYATGAGITQRNPVLTGTFDLLLTSL